MPEIAAGTTITAVADPAVARRVVARGETGARFARNGIVIDEWDEADPAALQRKFYARGVGNVRIGWAGEDDEKETMVLTRLGHLDSGALAQARDEARKLDQSAFRVLEDTYGKTQPVEHTP